MLAVIITLTSVFNRNNIAGQPISEWLRFLASTILAFEQFSQQIKKLSGLKGYQTLLLCELWLAYFPQKCAMLQWNKMDWSYW